MPVISAMSDASITAPLSFGPKIIALFQRFTSGLFSPMSTIHWSIQILPITGYGLPFIVTRSPGLFRLKSPSAYPIGRTATSVSVLLVHVLP